MARHNRITRKRTDKEELLNDPSAKGKEWLDKYGWHISILALIIFVGGLGAMAAAYYQKVTLRDANRKLFEAATLEQKAAFGAGPAQEAIDEYEGIIAKGKGGILEIQARMFAARLYMDNGNPAKAAEHFQKAAQDAGESSMLGEMNQAGLAQAWAQQGRTAEAEAKLQDLHKNARYYPKAEILMDLAYVQATAGKAEEAKKTLGQIKTGEEGLIAPAPVEELITRIEAGEITKGLQEFRKAMETAAKQREQDALVNALQQEETPKIPVAEGAVHSGAENKTP